MQLPALTEAEQRAIIGLCIRAAFADGTQDDAERAQVQRIVNGFSDAPVDLAAAYQEALGGGASLTQVAAQLQSPASRQLAYEMAVCVCHADGLLQETEQRFLAELRQALQLDPTVAEAHQQNALALVAQPLATPVPPLVDPAREADLDHLILHAAILNGALELMPHTLATLAIVPLQMRLVYQVGKRFGFELDRAHLKDFLATVGVGLTSQVFEGFARRLVGGLGRGLAGGLIGAVAGQAAGSTVGFATTYALGQVAKRYYASGRTLTTAQLKEAFSTLLGEARALQGRYAGDMVQKSRQVNLAELLPTAR